MHPSHIPSPLPTYLESLAVSPTQLESFAYAPCLQLESQLRQLRLRAESVAADVSQLKSELEAAQVERLSLQKRIGLLSRKNEDLAAENGTL